MAVQAKILFAMTAWAVNIMTRISTLTAVLMKICLSCQHMQILPVMKVRKILLLKAAQVMILSMLM